MNANAAEDAEIEEGLQLKEKEFGKKKPEEEPPEVSLKQRDRTKIVASNVELAAGLICLFSWFVLFACGVLIASGPLITAAGSATSILTFLGLGVTIALSWTLTNVGLLACVSAAMGAYGRRTRFTSRLVSFEEVYMQRTEDEIAAERALARVHYASAVMRGFGVYALALAGLLVLVTDSLLHPEQPEYVRLAATISVVSFYAEYDPEMLGMSR